MLRLSSIKFDSVGFDSTLDRCIHLCYKLGMLRTQIYLPVEYHQELAIMAQKLGVPKAVIIRKILKKALRKKAKSVKNTSPLLSLAKLKFRGGPKDLSERFDEYLYG